MKKLIVCFDGTWNNAEQEENGVASPTNVVRLKHALAAQDDAGTEQRVYYHPGVGGEDIGLKEKIMGGALGKGITRHLASAYHWLARHYLDGDQIFIYGFSRGAFTARSLGGFLGRGLLDLKGVRSKPGWDRVHTAFEAYRKYKKKPPLARWAESDWAFHNNGKAIDIHFLGVWDTVGALGIPDDLELLNLFDDKEDWQFHDTALGKNVKHARHAMALDEVRSSFTVTRWVNANKHPDAKELWFPGVHSDVGGGYAETDLSNGALIWMLQESMDQGLAIRDNVMASIKADPAGVIHNSYRGFFAKLRSRPRNYPAITPRNAARFHASVFARQSASPIEHPAYQPTVTLGINEKLSIDVFADTRWNETHLYLATGHEYQFSASGEWKDSKDVCDWRGTENDDFTAGDIARAAGSFLGRFEKLFKDNSASDFLGSKRVEALPWFTLVGAIANDGGKGQAAAKDGTPTPHQYVQLCDYTKKSGQTLRINSGGYLYCFPNDVWSLYDNNRGSIKLTITRTA